MTYLRLVFWTACVISFSVIAVQWFRVDYGAARLLAVLSSAWALFCFFWLAALLWQTWCDCRLPQFELMATVAVGLLAGTAVLFLVRFPDGRTD